MIYLTLIDVLQTQWFDIEEYRIPLCLLMEFDACQDVDESLPTIQLLPLLQQSNQEPKTVFVIDIKGNIKKTINLKGDAEPNSAMLLSQKLNSIVFWLGKDFNIYCKGFTWNPKNKDELLRDFKSRRRRNILQMDNYDKVLDEHF